MSKKPTAHVSLNKNRLKHYDRVDFNNGSLSNAVFLSDGDEFEIELDNPTETTYLAKIKINGERVSNSGIVLRPGEHIYLERYLDDKKKLKFDTYSVPKKNKEVISKNGLIEVEFYKEESVSSYSQPLKWKKWDYNDYDYNSDTITIDNQDNPSSFNIRYMSTCSTSSNQKIQFSNPNENEFETGRIEKGSYSDQTFSYVDKNFSTLLSKNVEIKILPKSHRPNVKQDIRTYCPNCGKKLKDSWNYCTNCGTEKP